MEDKLASLKEYIDEIFFKNSISFSNFPTQVAMLFVKKKNRLLQMYVDY